MSKKAPLPYRLLLLLLPPRFRRDFGSDLEAVLVERLRDAPGVAARAWIWLIAVADVLTSAAAEWAHALRDQRKGNVPRSNGMDHLKLDLRFAFRSLARRPGFAAIAVITLALGIGANTAIFSVVNGVLLRSLSYPDPDRLAFVWSRNDLDPSDRGRMSGPDIDDARALDVVASIEGFRVSPATLSQSGVTEVVPTASATGGLLTLFDMGPLMGRDLTHEDALEGAARVVVVSYDVWQTRLGGSPNVLGTTIELSEQSHEIVGIAPAGFHFPVGGSFGPDGAQLWTGHRRDRDCARGCQTYHTLARLSPEVTLGRASAELAALASRLSEEYPSNFEEYFWFEPLDDFIVGDMRRALWVVFYESDCQGRSSPSLIAWVFALWQSAPMKVEGARPWASGSGQSFPASFSSISELPIPIGRIWQAA